MEFKVLFNDNNSVEVLDEKLQKISVNELLQKLKESDYNEEHKFIFLDSNNNEIWLETFEGYGTTLCKINVDARFRGYYDLDRNASFELKFDMENINYHAFGRGTSCSANYFAFGNDVINDIIDCWWEKAWLYRDYGNFENIFNSILKIEFQRAIDYRKHNFSKIKEHLLFYQQRLLFEKKQIDDKLEHNSLLLTKLEDEYNKGLRLKK